MSRFVIHVGPHKTGSTYIQHGLLINRDRLLERGALYPDCFFEEDINWCHFGLFNMLRQGRQHDLEVRFEACKAVGADTIVLSAEDFSVLKESDLALLRSLTGSNAEIVFYLRGWCELLPSNAQEDIRQGGVRTLPEFCVEHLAMPFNSSIVNFGLKIDRIVRVFSTEHLRLVSFNNLLDEKKDIFTHFVTEILQLDASNLTLPTQRHQSASIQHIELLRALNVIRNAHEDACKLRLGALCNHDLSNLMSAMSAYESSMLLDEFGRPLSTLYDELAGRYANSLIPPNAGGRLFQRQKKRLPFISPNYILIPGTAEELEHLYRMITTREGA